MIHNTRDLAKVQCFLWSPERVSESFKPYSLTYSKPRKAWIMYGIHYLQSCQIPAGVMFSCLCSIFHSCFSAVPGTEIISTPDRWHCASSQLTNLTVQTSAPIDRYAKQPFIVSFALAPAASRDSHVLWLYAHSRFHVGYGWPHFYTRSLGETSNTPDMAMKAD